jgi:hypothetical protein
LGQKQYTSFPKAFGILYCASVRAGLYKFGL